MAEYFDVVDENDTVIGKASRKECHSGTRLLHRSIGIIITNSRGEFLFQKRSMRKDTDPGRWVVGWAVTWIQAKATTRQLEGRPWKR